MTRFCQWAHAVDRSITRVSVQELALPSLSTVGQICRTTRQPTAPLLEIRIIAGLHLISGSAFSLSRNKHVSINNTQLEYDSLQIYAAPPVITLSISRSVIATVLHSFSGASQNSAYVRLPLAFELGLSLFADAPPVLDATEALVDDDDESNRLKRLANASLISWGAAGCGRCASTCPPVRLPTKWINGFRACAADAARIRVGLIV